MRQTLKVNGGLTEDYDEYFNGMPGGEAEQRKQLKDVTKNIESNLWLSNSFPLSIHSLMTVLKTFSISGNQSMSRIRDFLKNESLKQVITENGFPVKIQIPVAILVKATVTFNKFRYLDNTKEAIREIFTVPSTYTQVSRKVGMKTLTNKKKRLAFANLAT